MLSGGGSKGAWQAGAIRALCEIHKYDYIVGTSVGSVNAMGLAYLGPMALQDMWRQITGTTDIMTLNWAWPWKWDGVFNFRPLQEFLSHKIGNLNLINPNAFAASLNLTTGLIDYLPISGDKSEAVAAVCGSCAVAGIQSPTNNHIDGGHKETAPIRFAVETLKADHIDVVLCDPVIEEATPWAPWSTFPILGIMLRALQCMIFEISRTDVSEYRSRINLYQPAKALPYNALWYVPAEIRSMLNQGYEDVKKQLTAGSL